jgi:hypothetical protein
MASRLSDLDALYHLFTTAPDYAERDRLVNQSLPTLHEILTQDDQDLGVYEKTLCILLEMVKQSPHSAIIKSPIVVDCVRWMRQV